MTKTVNRGMDGWMDMNLFGIRPKKRMKRNRKEKSQLHSNAWNQKSHKETWLAPEVPIPEARRSHCLAMQAKI